MHRPLVTLKIAQTLDGRIATSSGDSRWVSGPESRRHAHCLRGENDAILVGVGTVLADDPRLTVRHVDGPNPLRVVLDSRLRTPLDAAIFGGNSRGVTIFAASDRNPRKSVALTERGARIIPVPQTPGGLYLPDVLSTLKGLGVDSLLVEGGASVTTSFLAARLVDRVVIYLAPKLIGTGIDSVGNLGYARMDDAIQLVDRLMDQAGDDLIIIGKPVWPD